MIIDSHAHYSNDCYQKPFRYLRWGEDGYSLTEGSLERLLRQQEAAGIYYSVEPGISLRSCEAVLRLCVAQLSPYLDVAFFHHLILEKK